jgi:acetyl-CoA/propionyl-CoA carboxylase biotin carboxyl carrier protein
VDSGFGEGDEIPPAYDSLIAKLIAHGADREQARRRMLRALGEFEIEGIQTTIAAHQVLLENSRFVDGSYTTRTVEGGALAALMASTVAPTTDTTAGSTLKVDGAPVRLWNPAMARSVSALSGSIRGGGGDIVAPMHGTVLKVLVSKGDAVEHGAPVAVLETMKMEAQIVAGASGTIASLHVEVGDVVDAGDLVATVG